MARTGIFSLVSTVCEEPDAEDKQVKQSFHPRNSRIPAGDERTIKGAQQTFERKETFNIRGVEVEPSQLLGDNFSKHPLVSDLVSRQYNSLSAHTTKILKDGGDLYFLALCFDHIYCNISAFQIIENAKLWNGQTILWSYWLPQGKYLDIAKHPDSRRQPIHVLTPNFSGCSLVVDELDESRLRVYHVEGGKENLQYNDIPKHGLGLLCCMSYTDYGYYTRNGKTFENVTAYAFMQYSIANKEWEIHYQRQEHSPAIRKYQYNPSSIFRLFNKSHEITAYIAKGTRVLGSNRIKIKSLISDYNPWISRVICLLVLSSKIHHTLVSLWIWRSPIIDFVIHWKRLLGREVKSRLKRGTELMNEASRTISEWCEVEKVRCGAIK